MGARNELRLVVPIELKSALKNLAEAKQTSISAISLLLINQLLEREPKLLDILDSAATLARQEITLIPYYRQLLANYSLLKQQEIDDIQEFQIKAAQFIQEADIFVQQLNKGNLD